MKTPAAANKSGRPLSFDREQALHQAMLLFWRHGYEGSSLADLTAAMGINAPSLYGAFGDKRQLFLEAVNRYRNGPVTSEQLIDAAPTAREAARALLEASALGFTGAHTPPGCLLASAAIGCSPAADDVKGALARIRRDIEARLRRKVEAEGALPEGLDAGTLAAHVMAVIQGMSTLARDGAPREKLLRVARAALLGWPPPRRQRARS